MKKSIVLIAVMFMLLSSSPCAAQFSVSGGGGALGMTAAEGNRLTSVEVLAASRANATGSLSTDFGCATLTVSGLTVMGTLIPPASLSIAPNLAWMQVHFSIGGCTASWSTYTAGPAHGEGAGAFIGASLAPNGSIILAPHGSTHVGIYDPVAGAIAIGDCLLLRGGL